VRNYQVILLMDAPCCTITIEIFQQKYLLKRKAFQNGQVSISPAFFKRICINDQNKVKGKAPDVLLVLCTLKWTLTPTVNVNQIYRL